jgi:hypothetical protein
MPPTTINPPRTRASAVPGPGNPGEDDILRARRSIQNLDRFTPEHMAAYAAFAGITDRRTAQALHRHHVTWDDVNDYAANDLIGSTSYQDMRLLGSVGVTPAHLNAWTEQFKRDPAHRTANEYGVVAAPRGLTVNVIVAYTIQGITPSQAQPWNAVTFAAHWDPQAIGYLIKSGVSPDVAEAYVQAGVTQPRVIGPLFRGGCCPETVRAFRRANPQQQNVLAAHGALLLAAKQDQALARAAMRIAADPTVLAAWVATGENPTRIALFLHSGYSPNEWHANPEVRDLDDATLDVMAALFDRHGSETG